MFPSIKSSKQNLIQSKHDKDMTITKTYENEIDEQLRSSQTLEPPYYESLNYVEHIRGYDDQK